MPELFTRVLFPSHQPSPTLAPRSAPPSLTHVCGAHRYGTNVAFGDNLPHAPNPPPLTSPLDATYISKTGTPVPLTPEGPTPLGNILGTGSLPFTALTIVPSKSPSWCTETIATLSTHDETYTARRLVNVLSAFIIVNTETQYTVALRTLLTTSPHGSKIVRLTNPHTPRPRHPHTGSAITTTVPHTTLHIALPLPSSSTFKSTSKKKYHIATIQVYLAPHLKLQADMTVEPCTMFPDHKQDAAFPDALGTFERGKSDAHTWDEYVSLLLGSAVGGNERRVRERTALVSALVQLVDASVVSKEKSLCTLKLVALSVLIELRSATYDKDTSGKVLADAQDVGVTLEALGRGRDAIVVYEKVLMARGRIFGTEEGGDDTLTTVSKVAGVYAEKGDLEKALAVYKQAVENLTAVVEREKGGRKQETGELKKQIEELARRVEEEIEFARKEVERVRKELGEERDQMVDETASTIEVEWTSKCTEMERKFKANHDFFMEAQKTSMDNTAKGTIDELKSLNEKVVLKEMENHRVVVEKVVAETERRVNKQCGEVWKKERAILVQDQELIRGELEETLIAKQGAVVRELAENHEKAMETLTSEDKMALETARGALRVEFETVMEGRVEEVKVGMEVEREEVRKEMERAGEERQKAVEDSCEGKVREIEEVVARLEKALGESEQAKEDMDGVVERLQEELKTAGEEKCSAVDSLQASVTQLNDAAIKKEEVVAALTLANESLATASAKEVADLKLRSKEKEDNVGTKLEKTFAAHATELKRMQREQVRRGLADGKPPGEAKRSEAKRSEAKRSEAKRVAWRRKEDQPTHNPRTANGYLPNPLCSHCRPLCSHMFVRVVAVRGQYSPPPSLPPFPPL